MVDYFYRVITANENDMRSCRHVVNQELEKLAETFEIIKVRPLGLAINDGNCSVGIIACLRKPRAFLPPSLSF